MNQFPLWKNIIILFTLILGGLFTLPNFFGESPAIQIMPSKAGEKIQFTTQSIVESNLQKNNIEVVGTIIEPTTIKFKFKSPEDQILAKTLSEEILGNDYVVALNLISNSPQWLSSFGALPMYLGLDLRGGVHFLMELDLSKVSEKKSDSLLDDIRKILRDEKIPYFDSKLVKQTMQFKFKSESDLEKSKDIIRGLMEGKSVIGGKGPSKKN